MNGFQNTKGVKAAMKRKWTIIAILGAVCLLASAAAFGAGDKVKGMIISRNGDLLTVKGSGGTATVLLTEDTKTKDNKGLIGLRKEYMANTVLIPGLKVEVEGTTDSEGRVVAKMITVDGDDLETAEMIQAGLHPTAQQVQENTERFSKLGEYDVKAEATVKFAPGSKEVSPEDKEQLKKLAQTAVGLNGYLIEVKGFADSSGNAIMNEQLSEDRAEVVVGYLTQQCNVPVRHIVAPGALGEYQPAATNETKEGRAQNRRVEVKVLLNKGIAGK
jgi:outer membrane protein OmpA-like peptidoglycan-associated protein